MVKKTNMSLPENDIKKLEDLLFSEHLEEETLDYFGLHGLVCASVVGPATISSADILEIVFGDNKAVFSKASHEHFLACVQKITSNIQEELMQGTAISLPYFEEETHYDACLESWCIGFMEGFFINEKAWFKQDEEVAAELLLPIMALSGLYDSSEFQEVSHNDKIMSQFEGLIPEQLIDIYLYYQESTFK